FGHPTIAVDTHIFRVSNRTRLATGKTVLEVEKRLDRLIPAEYKRDAHHWLILHGRYTCVARTPRCGSCIIEDLCEFPMSQRPDYSKMHGEGAAAQKAPAITAPAIAMQNP